MEPDELPRVQRNAVLVCADEAVGTQPLTVPRQAGAGFLFDAFQDPQCKASNATLPMAGEWGYATCGLTSQREKGMGGD
ncbi:MAG: hypothetical protein HY318_07470 [Armatimonadetes bacterium]|nr:hypothetical protein [Armatimonadota bacterium]